MSDEEAFLHAPMKKSKKKGKSKHHNPVYLEDDTTASEECVEQILLDSATLQHEFDLLDKEKLKHHNPICSEDESGTSEEDNEQIFLNALKGLQEEMIPSTKIKMLKSSKLSRKSHKSKDSLRKNHVSRKNMRSRSPVRHPGNSRPPPMKHNISPGMKRGHPIPKRKASSPRFRPVSSSPHRSLSHRSKPDSPVPVERARPMKNLKYDKRRRISNSPVRHLGPGGPRRPISPPAVRDMSPYLSEQYQSRTIPHPQQYSPVRKKTRRSMSASPPRRHPGVAPMHSTDHIPRRAVSPVAHQKHRNMPLGPGEREKLNYDIRSKHESPHVIPRSHSKDISLKMPYPNQDPRYRSPSPSNRYPLSGSKTYGPTLHERFSSVVESNRTEPRVRYSREDLEKITIDIRRNVRDPSPIPRHGVHPSNAKVIRRADEGHRPIFDREEIKTSRYPREDVYIDNKSSSYSSIDLRNVENYQVTRHRYDSRPEVLPSTSGRSLSDRWPGHEGRKDIVSLDRDEREKDYVRVPVSRSHVVRSRSRSGDRDFRSERYIDAKPSSSRGDYQSRPLPPPEPRSSAPYPPRKNDVPPPDVRHKLNFRKGGRESHPPSLRSEIKSHYGPPELRYPEDLPPPRVDRRDNHSPIPEPHRWEYKSRSPSREKFSDYPRRPEKYDYKPWNDRTDMSPKGPPHFQHEPREGPSSFRGSSRPFRRPGLGYRGGRGYRGGAPRGGSFRGGSSRGGYRASASPRGRGIPRR